MKMFTVYEICAKIEFIEFDLDKSILRLTPYLGTDKETFTTVGLTFRSKFVVYLISTC